VKPCILIPTYDTPRTIEAVVEGARAHCPDIIVIDDGSGEDTRESLRRLRGITVIRNERNLGKGAALLSGLQEARRLGFTHAIAMDSDGQHLPEDIPLFLETAARSPRTLLLGDRDLKAAGAGPGSRFGRANSNFWTFVETGLRLPDTQCGFRSYPLEEIDPLHFATTGYDFEIEVLVRAAWTGVPIDSIPVRVRYFQGKERVSHFRPFLDFLRIARLNTRLVTLRICLPAPYLALLSLRRFRSMGFWRRVKESLIEIFVREPGSPRRIAASAGLGFFMGIAPIWGFQIAAAIATAHVLRLSKPVAVLASHISFPLVVPFILYASLLLGRLALGGAGPARSLAGLELTPADFPAWVAGSLILALATALVGGALIYLAVLGLRRIRRELRSSGSGR
jgi:glycosyltransferase involved in cell wall biosynthesis